MATTDPTTTSAPTPDPEQLLATVRAFARQLHVLRYRAKGVMEDFVFARPAQAREVAEKWLNEQPGRQFISIRQAIVADETGTIVALPAVPLPPPMPSGTAPRVGK